jgi:hypothetical protein
VALVIKPAYLFYKCVWVFIKYYQSVQIKEYGIIGENNVRETVENWYRTQDWFLIYIRVTGKIIR